MPINWSKIETRVNRHKFIQQLKDELITHKNYGWNDGNWNLTELAQEPLGRVAPFFMAISGANPETGREVYGAQLADPMGFPYFLFRLQVLSRQACVKDKDGNRIGNVDAMEPPEPGDWIEWKGTDKAPRHEVTMTTSELNTMRRRGERPHEYHEYQLDQDCCVMVPFIHALPMLQRHGERVVFPEFRGRGGARKIANWRFKEVPRDWRNPKRRSELPESKEVYPDDTPKKRGRKPKDHSDVTTDGSEFFGFQSKTIEEN